MIALDAIGLSMLRSRNTVILVFVTKSAVPLGAYHSYTHAYEQHRQHFVFSR